MRLGPRGFPPTDIYQYLASKTHKNFLIAIVLACNNLFAARKCLRRDVGRRLLTQLYT